MKFLNIAAMATLALAPTFVLGQSDLERIATEILADRFNINLDSVLGIRRETREDVWDLGPVLSMSRYGNRNASEVQRLRASGMGWGQIAKQIGMHPGTFNKLRNQGYFDRDPFWDDVMRRRYNVRQTEIDSIRRRGGRLEDILGSCIVAKGTNRPISDVYTRYRTTGNWDRTATAYKFDFNNWKRVGKRVGWDGPVVNRSKPSTPVRSGKSKGVGKGIGSGKGQGHGKPVEKGNSKGGGKGNGKGKGKGNH